MSGIWDNGTLHPIHHHSWIAKYDNSTTDKKPPTYITFVCSKCGATKTEKHTLESMKG